MAGPARIPSSPQPGKKRRRARSSSSAELKAAQPKDLLSPKELAAAIGVGESTIKRWVDDGLITAYRTVGGHRRIRTQEALRFVQEQNTNVSQPEILGLDGVLPARVPSLSHATTLLARALEAGDAAFCQGLLIQLCLDGHHVADIFDRPVREALAQLGHLWQRDEQGIWIEHRATQICLDACRGLRTLLPSPPPGAPLALGCCPSGDCYQLPTLGISLVLTAEGFRAVNLGPEMPLATFRSAILEQRPALAWISVSHCADPHQLRRDIKYLREQAPQTWLALGGKALPELDTQDPHLLRGQSFADLVSFARRCQAALSPG